MQRPNLACLVRRAVRWAACGGLALALSASAAIIVLSAAAQPANASAAGCVAGQCAADDAGIDPFHVDDDDPAPPAGAVEPKTPTMVRISALRPPMPTATSAPADGASRAPTTVNRPQPAQPTAPVVPARPAVSRLPTMPTMPTGGSVTMDF